jgi:hypothetical protein
MGERTENLRPVSAMEFSRKMSGIDDRGERNRKTMSATLDRLAAALESEGALARRDDVGVRGGVRGRRVRDRGLDLLVTPRARGALVRL